MVPRTDSSPYLRACALAYASIRFAAADFIRTSNPDPAYLLEECALQFRRSSACIGIPSSVFEDINVAANLRERQP